MEATLAAIVAHPTRARCFSILAERTASPVEIAQEIGKDVGHVGYHVRKLQEMNLIELVDERPVRGAVEHFYRAIERPILHEGEFAEQT
ncbi:MAG TPA: winged helix-turn-helix domain-containing protein, partial [Solirubrobacterales bacterium]|nr:winged helix-turn-helix domain-containing protein [Solirubrobacterales bacterium]